MAEILCVVCLMTTGAETVAEAQIEGTLYCREHALEIAATPPMRARLGLRRPRPEQLP